MRCLILSLLMVVGLAWTVPDVRGFALNGPLIPYQEPFSPNAFGYYNGAYGPQARDEEYRWNVPVVTYAFDQTFFHYFGTNGIRSVEQVFRTMNDIPPTSLLSDQVLTNASLSTALFNPQAAVLRIIDLKSEVTSIVMQRHGLISPETYVWSLRNRWVAGTPPQTNYVVMLRNFDPFTLSPSPVINGNTYGYSLASDGFVAMIPPVFTTFASGTYDQGIVHGTIITGLTRDDLGGIRYIYHTNNYNVERLLPEITFATGFAGIGGQSGATWSSQFPGAGTPGTPSSVWDVPFFGIGVTNDVVDGGDPTTNVLGPVSIGLRGGLNHVRYIRVNFDSLLTQGFLGTTNAFVDRYKDIATGIVRSQIVQRPIVEPDFLFAAGDLGVGNTPVFSNNGFQEPLNNYDLNGPGSPTGEGGMIRNGPGVFTSGHTYDVTTLLPWYSHVWGVDTEGPFDISPNLSGVIGVWGTFDEVNIEVIYPVYMNLSLQDLERLVLESNGQ